MESSSNDRLITVGPTAGRTDFSLLNFESSDSTVATITHDTQQSANMYLIEPHSVGTARITFTLQDAKSQNFYYDFVDVSVTSST